MELENARHESGFMSYIKQYSKILAEQRRYINMLTWCLIPKWILGLPYFPDENPFWFLATNTFLKTIVSFLLCMCDAWGEVRAFCHQNHFQNIWTKEWRELCGDRLEERMEASECQELFECRNKRPGDLDALHMEPVSAARLFEALALDQARPSECGELNWCGCLYKGTDDSRGGNANDLYGQ